MSNITRDLQRLQLLDELRGRLKALEYEPQLDPSGTRELELRSLIHRLEDDQLEAMHSS